MFSSTWFQQDGATAHTSNKTLEVLLSAFSRRIISHASGCTLPWAPRSPDHSAPYFFVWGHLKSLVYTNKLRTLFSLKKNIIAEVKKIIRAQCIRVLGDFVLCLEE